MRIVYLTLITAIVLMACNNSPTPTVADTGAQADTIAYDSALAKRLGADDYGMKMYVMALLKSGSNRDQAPEERAKLMRAHLDNIKRLAEEGKLVLAGPFGSNGDLRGIYVFDVETIEEAQALTETDPAIKAGSLEMELIPWYGTAALMGIDTLQKKISRKSI